MTKLVSAIFFLLMFCQNPAFASFAATGQSCELSPEQKKPEILAICSITVQDIDLDISLIGNQPNIVRQIRFINAKTARLVQKINLNATPLIDPETVALMFVDFNFDGHKDFAIMAKIETSDNVKYLYFLYDPKNRLFKANVAMTEIVNPEVMVESKHIRSYWRRNARTSGWNFWRWKNNRPYLAKRMEQVVDSSGNCQQITIRYVGKVQTKTSLVPCT